MFMRKVVEGSAFLAFAGVLGVAGAVCSPGSAQAADLTCAFAPGTDAMIADEAVACGSATDATSSAYARAIDAVAFARAEAGGGAVGLALDGAVAAGESVSGLVLAGAFGFNAVSIVSPDPGAIALAVSLAQGQTFVGTLEEGVRCDAGPGIAVNVTTGQVCLSDGVDTWSFVVALPE